LDSSESDSSSPKTAIKGADFVSDFDPIDDPENIRYHQLVMVYTCKQCNHRSSKTFSKLAYTKGVVIIRCPKCASLHLVADHLGYFDDDSQTVETILNRNKEKVVMRSLEQGDLELVKRLQNDASFPVTPQTTAQEPNGTPKALNSPAPSSKEPTSSSGDRQGKPGSKTRK